MKLKGKVPGVSVSNLTNVNSISLYSICVPPVMYTKDGCPHYTTIRGNIALAVVPY